MASPGDHSDMTMLGLAVNCSRDVWDWMMAVLGKDECGSYTLTPRSNLGSRSTLTLRGESSSQAQWDSL